MAIRNANIKVWLFAKQTSEIDWRDLNVPHNIGGSTYAGKAFRQSREWLETQRLGRKMVIAITDGRVSDLNTVNYQTHEGARNGIEYLLIGLDMKKSALLEGWPLGIRGITVRSKEISLLGDHLIQNVELT